MTIFMDIQKVWPNAHPDWKLVVRKKNGKTYSKEKKKVESNIQRILPNIQITKEVCQLH
tara:strand:- start:13 stop:189 length:177 start_codon:yes stop_codon:yes gene_type:complete